MHHFQVLLRSAGESGHRHPHALQEDFYEQAAVFEHHQQVVSVDDC